MPASSITRADDTSPESSQRPQRGKGNLMTTKLQMLNILLMMTFFGSQLTLPYTLSVYMVRDFYGSSGKSEQVIAQLTGLLAATQSMGRAVSSFPMGILCDFIGRKVCILSGLLAAIVSLLGYGFSTTYISVWLGRFIPSLFVGSSVALTAAMGDVCDQEGQAKAMAVFTLGWGLGAVVGPVVGGALAYPCRKFRGFPACGDGEFFHERPFSLPCLAVSCLGVLSILSMSILFKETHPQIAEAPGGWRRQVFWVLTCRPSKLATKTAGAREENGREESESARQNTDIEAGEPNEEDSSVSGKEVAAACSSGAKDPGSRGSDEEYSQQQNGGNFHQLSDMEEKAVSSAAGKLARADLNLGDKGDEVKNHQDYREGDENDSLAQPLLGHEASPVTAKQPRWWSDRNVILALIGSGCVALIFNFNDELAPLYVSAPREDGGLAMSLESFTWPIGFGGAVLIVYSLTLYPKLIKWLGAISSERLALMLGLPGSVLMPLASVMPSQALQQVCVYSAVTISNSVAKLSAINSSVITVNLVADKSRLGRINGASLAMQSTARAVGPLLSGLMWAGSVSFNHPGQQFLGFGVIMIALIGTQFLYRFIRVPKQD